MDLFDAMEADVTKTTDYKGFKLERRDPYGFVHVSGKDEVFTSFSEAEKAIDAELRKAELEEQNKTKLIRATEAAIKKAEDSILEMMKQPVADTEVKSPKKKK